tara:strand:+ start:565 stop:1986 length:1422 start_codon:yes stop_codon:yes gene_type:complete
LAEMESVESLIEKYGARLLELHKSGDPIGRKRIARLITEWSGEFCSEWRARGIRSRLPVARNKTAQERRNTTSKIMKPQRINQIVDEQKSFLDRELFSRGQRIKTLPQLLDAAEVDLNKWRVSSWRANSWEQASRGQKGVEITTLHQVKANLELKLSAQHRPAPKIVIKHKPRKLKKAQYRKAMYIPDSQCGFKWDSRFSKLTPLHDRVAFDAIIQFAEQWQPDQIVLLGDMADLGCWSLRFPSDNSLRQTTQPTIDELGWWLARLRAAVGESTSISYLEGNHEARVFKRKVHDNPEQIGLTAYGETKDRSHISSLLRLDDLGIEYIGPYGADQWMFDGRVRVTHGHTVRQGGGATAAAVLKNSDGYSTVYGHIHRLEYAEKTIHGPPGVGRRTVAAMSPGCICSLVPGVVPGFKPANDWQHGVGIGIATDEFVQLSALPIRKGKLVFGDGIIEGKDPRETIARDTGWAQFGG